jgi:putative hydrolase of the HAD superfamily
MLKTVYFDMGNVLVFFNPAKMFAQLAQCTGLSGQEVQKLIYTGDLVERHETGKMTTEQVYRLFLQSSPRSFTLQQFKTAASDIFTPNTALWPLVEELKRQGIRLILLSNTSECHFHYINAHYPILRHFDHKVLSFEVGAWKPNPEIFQHALAHAQCAPEECFYTDDIPDFIEGARRAGLPGEVFTTVDQLKKHLAQRGCSYY